MNSSNHDTIVAYYDGCEVDYRKYWDLEGSLALHAGFWDDTTSSLAEALKRENQVLAEWVQVNAGDRVLDAGCGVGGSSIFLAETYGCHVTGITLSEKQVETARGYAKDRSVSSFVDFEVRDFCDTGFPSGTFDVVWGIESVCHAFDKQAFVREAYRLLKPGGRLVVADGFAKKSGDGSDKMQMQKWLKGWGVEALDSALEFRQHLEDQQFGSIFYRDVTHYVLPSSKRLFWISLPAWVGSKFGEYCGWRSRIQTDNIAAAYYQYMTLTRGLWEYGVFTASRSGSNP